MKHLLKQSVLAAIAVAPLLTISAASAGEARTGAYLTDRDGRPIEVRSVGCMRTRDWTPSRADAHCKARAEKLAAENRVSK